MAVKVTLDATQGLVQENVAAGSADALPQGFSPHRLGSTQLSANTTLGVDAGGVYAITSSTGGAKTVTLPLAASSAGMLLAFRATSNDAHVITASAETNGTRALNWPGLSIATNIQTGSRGSSLALATDGALGASALIMCDGKNWLIMGGSGSLSLTGT